MRKGKGKITNYMLFCETCGAPKMILKIKLKGEWILNKKVFERCGNCKALNEVPEYLLKIAGELQ